MSDQDDHLGRRVVRGTLLLSLINYATLAVSLGVSIFFARLLGPRAVGIVALALIIIDFLQIGARWGVDVAIIQDKGSHTYLTSTVLVLTVVYGFAMMLVGVALYFLLGNRYESEVLQVMVVLIAFKTMGMVASIFQAEMRKHLMFTQIGVSNAIGSLSGSAAGVLLALLGAGIWSLVAYRAVNLFVTFLFLWVLSPWKLSLKFNISDAKWFCGFEKKMFPSQILELIFLRADHLVVGSLAGPTVLGFYSKANEFSMLFTNTVQPALNTTILPLFSKVQNQPQRSKRLYNLVLRTMSILSVFVYALLGLLAPEIVKLVYGSEWLPMVPLIRVLCVYGSISPLLNMNTLFHYARGTVDAILRVRVLGMMLFLPSLLVFGQLWEGIGAAISLVICSVAMLLLITRETNSTIRVDAFGILVVPVVCGLGSVAVSMLALNQLQLAGSERFVIVSTLFLVVYIALGLLLARKLLVHDFSNLIKVLFAGSKG